MKILSNVNSLDYIQDGDTRILPTKTESSGNGNVVSSVSISGDTITYNKGVTALTAHQNAFSNVKVGSTTVAADTSGDTLELVAGDNVTLTPDSTNDKVTIAATDTTYESKAAASGGTAVSLVTTGEKYTWNNKASTDTKNTAGSTNSTSKMYLIGATEQNANPQTYSNEKIYGTNGELIADSFSMIGVDNNKAGFRMTQGGGSSPRNNMDMGWDWNSIAGSGAAFRGTEAGGNFIFFARKNNNGTAQTSQLQGTPAGSLTWAGNEVVRGASKGGANQPVYIDSSGIATACTAMNYSIEKPTGTIDDLAAFTSGKPGITGSINITKKTEGIGSEIPGGWYNFFYSPHRTGSTGDNPEYGNIILTPMTFSGSSWILRRNSSTEAITEVKKIATGDIPTKVSQLTNDSGYTTNTGTITKVQANGTDVASSGTANIPAATTSKYGVTELSSATNSTSEALAATPKAVKAAYDLAASKGTGTITGVSVNGTSVATSGVANITSVPASILSGAIPSAVTATTQSASDNSTKLATTAFVKTAIDNLPEPMVFKGSLGTGGTVTALPVDGSATVGDTYKVITAGTYASKAAKVGDTFICLTKTSSANTWELIPSGDEPSGTVTSITLKATSPIAIDSSSAITASGTRTLSHANSGVTAGTYRSVTVNATGHVTAGTNPTTLSGYGITDAKIDNGVITLGSETITPLTASSTLDATKVSGTLPTSTYTDTKNTAGSTDSSSKLFLIGATSQAANPQTYSQDTAYVDTNGHLYSNSKQVVNLSDSQALTNKTYNGYTLAAACAKAVVTSIDTSASLPTSNAVKTFVEGKGYVLKSGDTMTGALNFANNTVNKVGDDVSFGDFNKAGMLGIIGQNGTTGIALIKNGSTWGTSAERAEMIYNSTDKCIEFNFA